MSAAAPDPDRPDTDPEDDAAQARLREPVRVDWLLARTVEEIATSELRRCDGCGEIALYGCVARVGLGYAAERELCDGCFAQLADRVNVVARAIAAARPKSGTA